MIQYPDSLTKKPITQKHVSTGIVVSTLVAVFMAVLILGHGRYTEAQDPQQVCGNGAKEAHEQCDDGDLRNGDGCSSQCTIEKCGNGIVDYAIGEQCDGTPGCDAQCHLEYCGDGRVQNGEQCDDGNGVSDDGCSSVCSLESAPTDVVTHPSAPEPKKPVPLQNPRPPVDTTVIRTALQTLSDVFFAPLPSGTKDELSAILRKVSFGRISVSDRDRGLFIVRSLHESLQHEQEITKDAIRSLVDISASYFSELGINMDMLRSTDPAIVLAELERIAPVRTSEEIHSIAVQKQEFLADLGLRIPVPSERATSGEMFRDLVEGLKVLSEQKTENLDRSLASLHDTEGLKGALRTFEAEHALEDATVQQLSDRLEKIVISQTPIETVSAVRAFTKELESVGALAPSELMSGSHSGAPAKASRDDAMPVVTSDKLPSIIEEIPADTVATFKKGMVNEQAEAFRVFLQNDERLSKLQSSLAPDRRAVYREKFQEIDRALDHIVAGKSVGTCDTSMSAVFICANRILADLEAEVRSSLSLFDQTVHYLQDRFYHNP